LDFPAFLQTCIESEFRSRRRPELPGSLESLPVVGQFETSGARVVPTRSISSQFSRCGLRTIRAPVKLSHYQPARLRFGPVPNLSASEIGLNPRPNRRIGKLYKRRRNLHFFEAKLVSGIGHFKLAKGYK